MCGVQSSAVFEKWPVRFSRMSDHSSGWVSADDFPDDDHTDSENTDHMNSAADLKRESCLQSFERTNRRLSARMRELIDDPLQKDAELIRKKWEREDELKDREQAEFAKCSFTPKKYAHYTLGQVTIRPRTPPERTIPDDEKEWEWIRIEARPPPDKKHRESFFAKTKVNVLERVNKKRRPKIERQKKKVRRSADMTEFFERDEQLCKRRAKFQERQKKRESKPLTTAQLKAMAHGALNEDLERLYRTSLRSHRGGELDDEEMPEPKVTSPLTFIRLALPKQSQVAPPPPMQVFDHRKYCFSHKSQMMTRGAVSLFDREVYDFDDLLEEYRILHNMSE